MRTLRCLAALVAALATNFAIAQNATLDWVIALGDSTARGSAVALDPAGNVYTTGYFDRTVDFDPGAGSLNLTAAGEWDVYACKYNANGGLVWAKQLGGPDGESSLTLGLDPAGNVYLVGAFSGTADFDPGPGTFQMTPGGTVDLFICKLDPAGDFVWAKQIGSSLFNSPTAIALDAAGNVHLTGYFSGMTDFDPGPATFNLTSSGSIDAFMLKLGTDGSFQWAVQFGGVLGTVANAVAVDPAGNVYATGQFGATVDFDPGPGTNNLTASGNEDAYLCKLNSAGNLVWAKQIGGLGSEYGNAMQLDGAGNIYLTGIFQGTSDFDPGAGDSSLVSQSSADIFILKLDAAGNFTWVRGIGGPGNKFANAIALDPAGNSYTTGMFDGQVDFDPGPATFDLTAADDNTFIHKLDANGNFAWVKHFEGIYMNEAYSIAVDATGEIYTTGSFTTPTDFDPGLDSLILAPNLARSAFLHKLTQNAVAIAPAQLTIPAKVYPNPSTGTFLVDLGDMHKKVSMTVVDALGRVVQHATYSNAQRIPLYLEGAAGVYVLKVATGSGQTTVRLVKQ